MTFKLLRRLLGIDLREVTLERRGFTAKSSAAKRRLEQIGESFLGGYHAALIERWPDGLADRLHLVEQECRGFAYEGAAMALYLLDCLTPWPASRWKRFLAGPGSRHPYMVHVGAGWVFGRLPVNPARAIGRMDPMLGWLAIEGYAFHQAYFRPQQAVYGGLVDPSLKGYARRVWDMGVGRALWFVEGMDVNRIAIRIKTFDITRRGDLWSGVGLACAYAGSADLDEINYLVESADVLQSQFAQGVAFAAKARHAAGNIAEHTELVTRIVWEATAQEAAKITDDALVSAVRAKAKPSFEVWRLKIQSRHGAGRVPSVRNEMAVA